MQKNRRPIILCSKLSLIHTIDAPYKYFEYALIVSFYLDFLRLNFVTCPAGFAKSHNYKVHTHTQKNRTPIILCSKLSLIHTIDAPYKYFKSALIVSFYLDFLRFGFAFSLAGFAKSDNYKVTLLICNKIAHL